MGKWHGNESPMEHWCRLERKADSQAPVRYDYSRHFKMLTERTEKTGFIAKDGFTRRRLNENDGTLFVEICAFNTHAAYEKYQRPSYLVSRELFDCVSELDVSEQDMTHIFERLPYPCFSLVFEAGIYDNKGDELQSLFICNEHDRFPLVEFFGGTILSVYVKFPAPGILTKIGASVHAMPVHGVHGEISPDTLDRLLVLRKCVAALVMLWRSRPEFVVDVALPRSERYQFKGDRKLIRTWKFPDKLIVRKPHGESAPTGRHVKAHWRAGHFRRYQHERYERELDGSVKVEFIAPCVIHADELAKESTRGT